MAPNARRWIASFRESSPDVHMTIVDLIAEADKVPDHPESDNRPACHGGHLVIAPALYATPHVVQ